MNRSRGCWRSRSRQRRRMRLMLVVSDGLPGGDTDPDKAARAAEDAGRSGLSVNGRS